MNAIELSLMSFDLASGSFTVSLSQSDELVSRLLKIETESSQMAGLAETDMDPRIDTDLKIKLQWISIQDLIRQLSIDDATILERIGEVWIMMSLL